MIVLPPGSDSGYVEMITSGDLGQRQVQLEARAGEITDPTPDDDEAGRARRRAFRGGDPALPGAQSPPLRSGMPKRWGTLS